MHVVNEQIVPYKGRSSMKQYNTKKPHKICILADGKSVYDFEVFTGNYSKFCSQYSV